MHFKSSPQIVVMENIQATHLLQLVHLDYLTIKVTKCGKGTYVSILTDHFTWYAQAVVKSLQTAKCTVQTLWDQCVVYYGLPESIVSEQDWNFESDFITELCKLAKVQKMCTGPYHLQTNWHC